MLCIDCGLVTSLTEKDVQLRVSKLLGSIQEVLIRGHCESCQSVKYQPSASASCRLSRSSR